MAGNNNSSRGNDLYGADLGEGTGLDLTGVGGGGKFRKFSPRTPKKECDDVNDPIDYKNLPLLHKYLTPQGKLQSRKRTKYCAQCQRKLSNAVKLARFIGLLPYVI